MRVGAPTEAACEAHGGLDVSNLERVLDVADEKRGAGARRDGEPRRERQCLVGVAGGEGARQGLALGDAPDGDGGRPRGDARGARHEAHSEAAAHGVAPRAEDDSRDEEVAAAGVCKGEASALGGGPREHLLRGGGSARATGPALVGGGVEEDGGACEAEEGSKKDAAERHRSGVGCWLLGSACGPGSA